MWGPEKNNLLYLHSRSLWFLVEKGLLSVLSLPSEEGFGGWRDAQKKNSTHLLADCAIFSLVCLRQRINFHGIFFLRYKITVGHGYIICPGDALSLCTTEVPTVGKGTSRSYFGDKVQTFQPCIFFLMVELGPLERNKQDLIWILGILPQLAARVIQGPCSDVTLSQGRRET